WMVPKGSEISGITNAIGEVVYYNGAAGSATLHPGLALPGEYYSHRKDVKSSAYETAGVSQGIASGTKDPGVNSGRAQRERYDIANGRLILHAQRLEKFYEACASVVLGLMRLEYGTRYNVVRAPATDLVKEVDWSDIDLREDEIELRCFAVSSLSNHPAQRSEQVAEWLQMGVITKQRAAKLLASPDLDRF